MSTLVDTKRFLMNNVPAHLQRPVARLQPLVAKQGGELNIDLVALRQATAGVVEILEPIAIRDKAHWRAVLGNLSADVDAILPVSITAYPTEIWNADPQPLVERRVPVVFWSILKYDEPDFWRWSACDMLRAVGATVHLVQNNRHGLSIMRALAMRRFLADSRLVVFGEQNFPWNAHAAGGFVTRSLQTRVVVHPLDAFRRHYPSFSDAAVDQFRAERCGKRYQRVNVRDADLRQAVRTYLSIREVLRTERALGFGVNCFGDLITGGGRDVPCLAQLLAREEGYIASCDGDFLAMMSMVLASYFLDKPCMMSNLYPLRYAGALTDHFGDPLSPNAKKHPRAQWKTLARMAHCGFVGVVSPEMSPLGSVPLHDWGGTYEMKRDGRGCGTAGDLAGSMPMTAIELKFDGKTLLIASGEICETTHHAGMPHCEKSALLRFRDLEGFVANISREHAVVVYGDHVADFQALATTLGLDAKVF